MYVKPQDSWCADILYNSRYISVLRNFIYSPMPQKTRDSRLWSIYISRKVLILCLFIVYNM